MSPPKDNIPLIELGLQHIYKTEPLKNAVFAILEEGIPYKTVDDVAGHVAVATDKGRPGMEHISIRHPALGFKCRLLSYSGIGQPV